MIVWAVCWSLFVRLALCLLEQRLLVVGGAVVGLAPILHRRLPLVPVWEAVEAVDGLAPVHHDRHDRPAPLEPLFLFLGCSSPLVVDSQSTSSGGPLISLLRRLGEAPNALLICSF